MKKMMIVAIVVVVAVVAIAAASVLLLTKPSEGQRKIYFQLSWMPVEGHISYFYSAAEVWPEMGLDVTIVRGAGSGDTIMKVGQGVVEFGEAAFEQGVNLRAAQGYLVKSVFGQISEPNMGWMFLIDRDAGRGVIDANDPTTMEGKIYGGSEWDGVWAPSAAVAELLGVDWSTVEFVSMDQSARLPAMIEGTIDMTGVSIGNVAIYEDQIKEALPDAEIGTILFKDVPGWAMFGDVMWASDRTILDDPELVEKFVQGMQRGFTYSVEHLEEAAHVMAEQVPEYQGNEQVLVDGFIDLFGQTLSKEESIAHGVGWLNPAKVPDAVVNSYFLLNVDPSRYLDDPQEIATNEFIDPSIYPTSWPW